MIERNKYLHGTGYDRGNGRSNGGGQPRLVKKSRHSIHGGALKVCLVVPNFRWTDSDPNALWQYFPYNLCMITAMIEEEYHVNILDAYSSNMSQEEFRSALAKQDPDVVGITVLMDQYAPAGHETAKIVKESNEKVKVVLGGVYATTNPEKAASDPNIDYVVIGEGEYVFHDLLDFFLGKKPLPEKGLAYRSNGQVVVTCRADFIDDLDALPFPSYHLIDFQSYANASPTRKSVDAPLVYPFARLVTTRGCPYLCSFCQAKAITGREFRYRSVENIMDEIQWLKDKYGVKSLIFDDDNLYTNKERAKVFFRRMSERGLAMPWKSIATAVFRLDEELVKLMRESGCEYVDVAIESGTERVMREIIKKPIIFDRAKEMIRCLRQQGIYVAANFIIGFPTETWEEVRQTIKMAEDMNCDYVKIFIALPLPETELYELTKKHNAFKQERKTAGRIWSTGQMIETEYWRADDLTVLRAYEWDRINFTDPVKRKRTADMMGITVEELDQIRMRTLGDACLKIKESDAPDGDKELIAQGTYPCT